MKALASILFGSLFVAAFATGCGGDDGVEAAAGGKSSGGTAAGGKASGGQSSGGQSSGGQSSGGANTGGASTGTVDSCGAGLALVDPGTGANLYGTSGAFKFAWLAIGDTNNDVDATVARLKDAKVSECDPVAAVKFAAADNSVFKDWGSELDLHLNVTNVGEDKDQKNDVYEPADLSGYRGLAFNARSSGPDAKVQLKVLVATAAQTPVQYGGSCTPKADGSGCYDFPAQYYDLDKDKDVFVEIDFATLQPTAGKLDKVMKLGFYIATAGTKTGAFSAPAKAYAIQLSHVGFYK